MKIGRKSIVLLLAVALVLLLTSCGSSLRGTYVYGGTFMEQEKFVRIGEYITAGDIDTAARLISELIDEGLSPLSFEASAVLSIIT